MAYEFRLPDIGEGLTEAEVVRWLVDVGSEVDLDQPLVEVETDKAVVEIPSPKGSSSTTAPRLEPCWRSERCWR